MGRRGPHPKPIEVRDREGSYNPAKHGPRVSLAPRPTGDDLAELLPTPESCARPVQQKAWADFVERLKDSGILQAVDAVALEAAALALATMREAQDILDNEGLLVEGRFGNQVAHPMIAVRDKAAAELRQWCARFGMTPSDRAALGLAYVKGRTAQAAWEAEIGKSPREGGTDAEVIDSEDTG